MDIEFYTPLPKVIRAVRLSVEDEVELMVLFGTGRTVTRSPDGQWVFGPGATAGFEARDGDWVAVYGEGMVTGPAAGIRAGSGFQRIDSDAVQYKVD